VNPKWLAGLVEPIAKSGEVRLALRGGWSRLQDAQANRPMRSAAGVQPVVEQACGSSHLTISGTKLTNPKQSMAISGPRGSFTASRLISLSQLQNLIGVQS